MKQALRRMAAVLVCLGVLLAGVPAGAAPPPLVITAKDSGKTLALTVGQRLNVDLKLAGDDAVVTPEFDPFILTLRGQTLQSTSTPQGSSVQVKYEFEARKAGETDLIIPVKSSKERSGPGRPLLKIHLKVTTGMRT